MKLRTRLAAAAASAALVAGAGLAAAPSASATSDKTILSVVNSVDRFTSTERDGLDRFRWDQRNWYDFDILTAAVVLDGNLVEAVTTASTEVTLFAPNDRAFQLLARDLTGKWLWTEKAVLDAIVGAVQAGTVNLTNVLTYHVVGLGKFLKADVVPLIGSPIPTLNGGTITVQAPNLFGFIEIKDEVDSFRNPFLVTTDIDAGNSVIHSISRVLIPANV